MISKHKKRTAGITASLTALLLITGTFAWSSISQHALNEKSGKTNAGGRIHDDYHKESGNEDIYAENYSAQRLIVRVKVSEYMENNGKPLVTGTEKANKKTWIPYGLPHSEATDTYRKYVTWTLGGDKNFLPTFNTNNESLETDATGDAIDILTNGQTALGDGTQNFFTEGQEVTNPDDSTVKHIVKSTLKQTKEPISMATWKELPDNQKKGDYWVIDTDGWAYWANLLAPKESTSLLLDQLNWQNQALGNLDDWYYTTHVIGEFTTQTDMGQFDESEDGKPSADANELLAEIRNSSIGSIEFITDVSTTDNTSKQVNQLSSNEVIPVKELTDDHRLILYKERLPKFVKHTTADNRSSLKKMMKPYYNGRFSVSNTHVRSVQKELTANTPDRNEVGRGSHSFLITSSARDHTVVTSTDLEKTTNSSSLAKLTDDSLLRKSVSTISTKKGIKEESTTYWPLPLSKTPTKNWLICTGPVRIVTK